MSIPDFTGIGLHENKGFRSDRITATPRTPRLNPKWEVKEKKELVEYYVYKAKETEELSEICFFLNGYLDIKSKSISKDYLWKEVKAHLDFIYNRGYTAEDIGRNFNISQTVISKILRGEKDAIHKKILLALAFQLDENLILNYSSNGQTNQKTVDR